MIGAAFVYTNQPIRTEKIEYEENFAGNGGFINEDVF